MAWNDRAVARTDAKQVRCKPCKDGKHYPDCEERACQCHCISRSEPFRARTRSVIKVRDLSYVLQRLKDHGVIARLGGECPDYQLMFSPHPKNLPDEIRALITQYRRDLLSVLAPRLPHTQVVPPYWTQGGLRACVCCGGSTVWTNPLGEHCHPHCGYLNRRQEASMHEWMQKAVRRHPLRKVS